MTPEDYLEEPESEEPFSLSRLRHYIHAPLRRPLLVIIPWVVILALSVATLYLVPKRYDSFTMILVESEKAPDSFITRVAAATTEASRRVENIRAKIYSRTMLERVLEETQPYPDIASRTQGVQALSDAIYVGPEGTDGFTISYSHRDPAKAQEVVDRLATLFIEETLGTRGEQVEEAVDFLVSQVEKARSALEEKEEAVRRFKEKRMGRLPEQLDANLATLEMLQRELEALEERLLFAREREAALARGVSRANAAGAVSSLSTDSASREETEYEALLRQLRSLSNRYTDDHPDVRALRSRLERLQAPVEPSQVQDDDRPATPNLIAQEQLAATVREIERLEGRRADLEERIASIRSRVEETPRTEQELATMERDYEMLSENYTSLLARQLDAEMAERLERRWKGDQFRILDPANLPEEPSFPKPALFIIAGLVGGLFAGLGAALAAEFLDPTVKDAEQLGALVSQSVLARIPHIPDLESPNAR
jgi:polysaccharide chain length determinant protein (PEP-CTERM system associated)